MARNSNIIIAENIKLDSTYKNVLSYNQAQMLELVNDNKVAIANNYSFIRQEQNMVQVGFAYSTICNANYMAFQNKDYNNKWFFAFIRDIQYVSDNCVNIVFDIDVWSTFYSNLTINKCFVEREHVNDDTIGLHTVPENISSGEIVQEKEYEDTSFNQYLYIAVMTDWHPISSGSTGDPGKQFQYISVYNRGIFAHQIVLFKLQVNSQTGDTTPDITNLIYFLTITNDDGHIEDIKDMFIVPSALINETYLTLNTCHRQHGQLDVTANFWSLPYTANPETITISYEKVHSFTGITDIKNNKCYCYPYNYLLVTNNQGNQNIYKYEDFAGTNFNFEYQLALTIGVSGRCVPVNYKGQDYANDESVPLGKYPTCAWSTDSFTNWLTQQALNIPTKIASTILGTGVAIGTGQVGGGLLYGATSIAGLIGEFRNESLKPNIEGGGNTADVIHSAKQNTFVIKCMRSKLEYLRIIDSYFTRFGYKINETKTPNLTGRTNFNYIKIGGNDRFATGNIQSKFLDTINQIAQQGVTIWHNHANIGDFSVSNTIVT